MNNLAEGDLSLGDALASLDVSFAEDALSVNAFMDSVQNPCFIVANAGAMNPGKSTLLNSILGKPEIFKTADVRETVKVQEAHWGKDIVLLDTPGCSSAVLADDKESYSAFRRADFIIFVHNVNNGGINKAELDILKGLKEIFCDEFPDRVCFVGTRSDDCQDDSSIQQNMDEAERLIRDNLGVTLKMFKLSPKLHLEGLSLGCAEDRDELIKLGQIEPFKRYLKAQKKKLGKLSSSRIAKIVEKLKGFRCKVGDACADQKKSLQSLRNAAKRDWQGVLSDVRPSWDACK